MFEETDSVFNTASVSSKDFLQILQKIYHCKILIVITETLKV